MKALAVNLPSREACPRVTAEDKMRTWLTREEETVKPGYDNHIKRQHGAKRSYNSYSSLELIPRILPLGLKRIRQEKNILPRPKKKIRICIWSGLRLVCVPTGVASPPFCPYSMSGFWPSGKTMKIVPVPWESRDTAD